MTICHFFQQGRCRYGDRCWNEHPRGGGGGGRQQQEQPRHQQPPSGGYRGSYNQRYVQPPKSSTWTSDEYRASFNSASDSRDPRSRDYNSGSSQNRFAALNTPYHSREPEPDKDGSLLDEIKRDMEVWDSSGQWIFSVYGLPKEKINVTGFTDISLEELRLECYTAQSNGNLQNYVNSVQQLHSQWKQRLHELQNLNPSSQAALMADLSQPTTASAPTFGGQQSSGFGTSNPSFGSTATSNTNINFSFKAEPQNPPANTGPLSTFSGAPGFGTKPPSGFGSTVTGSAASFSFAATTASDTTASGFGNKGVGSAASFSFAPTSAPSAGASAFPGVSSAAAPPASTPATSGFGGSTTNSAFGGGAGAAPGFGGGAGAAPGFGGGAGAAPIFGGGAGAAPGFGGGAGAAPIFGGGAGAVQGFGGGAGAAPIFGGGAGAVQGFGGGAGAAPGFGGGAGAAPGFGGGAGTAPGFGAFSSNTGFGAQPTAVSDLFKAGAANPPSGSLFGQPPGALVSQTPSTTITASSTSAASSNDDPLFTPRSGLSAEELSQFESKRFTLTKIPRLPPPADLLMV